MWSGDRNVTVLQPCRECVCVCPYLSNGGRPRCHVRPVINQVIMSYIKLLFHGMKETKDKTKTAPVQHTEVPALIGTRNIQVHSSQRRVCRATERHVLSSQPLMRFSEGNGKLLRRSG